MTLDVRLDHFVAYVPRAAPEVATRPHPLAPVFLPQTHKLPLPLVRTLPLHLLHQLAHRHLRRVRHQQVHVISPHELYESLFHRLLRRCQGLDHFKTINDQFGHECGDQLLRAVSKIVNETIRPMDLFARVGGDEFLILLPDVQPELAQMVAERVRMAVRGVQLEYQGQTVVASASIGVVEWDGKMGLDALIASADKALYRAKASGRNSVVRA